jgi:uncharacterized protein (DUF58 family)
MFYPTPRTIRLFLLVLLCYAAALYLKPLLYVGACLNIVFLILWIADGFLTLAPSRLVCSRHHEKVISQGEELEVSLSLKSESWRRGHLEVVEDHPDVFTGPAFPLHGHIGQRGMLELEYRMHSYERASHKLGPTWIRSYGALGFAWKQAMLPVLSDISVYPQVSDISRYDLLLTRGGEREAGNRRVRQNFEGSEFTSLRDYNLGDDYRLISWKHTARRGKYVIREFEPERRQNVMIMIDAGRMMTNRIGDYTRLDYAINTAIHLARICLLKGDRVGVMGFGHDVQSSLPARSGKAHLTRIIDQLAALQAQPYESDYVSAFAHLARSNTRRSLVVIFTEILDRESSRTLLARMRSLVPRHLPCCVTIQDSDLLGAACVVPEDMNEAYRRVVAADLIREKSKTLGEMARGGAQIVHVPADEMSVATINQYLDIKKRGIL